MEYSIVENNIVTNTVVADAPLGDNWHEGNHGMGAVYDPVADTFTLPQKPTPDPVSLIPQAVSMRQARLALLQAGILATVDQVIAGITPTEAQQKIKIEWDYATEVDRQWPTLLALQSTLELTDEQVDDLFILAATL
jgi:hypothetical protein